jgi:hypothetical protein
LPHQVENLHSRYREAIAWLYEPAHPRDAYHVLVPNQP